MAKPEVKIWALVFPDKRIQYAETVEGFDHAATLAQFKSAHGEFEAHEVSRDAFPTDRTFVAAWIWDNGTITHDMAKAREIHREAIRKARAPLLAELDVQFQRNLETGADSKAIVAKKQALRDAPSHPDIDKAQTPDDLKAVWPL